MKPNCRASVRDAAKELGREDLTDAHLDEIDATLRRTMRELARTEDGWQSLSASQRIAMAGQRAAEDAKAAAERKVRNAELQVLKTAATEQRIEDLTSLRPGEKRSEVLVRDMDHTSHYVTGIKLEAMSRLAALMDGVKDGSGASVGRRVMMFLWNSDNPVMTRDLAAEVYANADGHTGNAIAKEGAKAWLQTIEELRNRFNAAGGDVGKLEYGYLPQPHDAARVRQVGRDAWVDATLPKMDRARFVDEAGAQLTDAQLREVLARVWETIATEGLNKQEPGAFKGSGARANRGTEHRELHFRSADDYLAYMSDFGSGSMYDAMTGHLGAMAKDIGLVERYGPNPASQMRLQFDLAARADGAQVDNLPRSFGLRPQSYWDVLSGNAGSPASARIASVGQHVRNVQTFGKLAGAVISSITDMGTYMVSTGFNRLPYWDSIANIGRSAASKDAREFMTSHGIIAESMAGDLTRWTGDNLQASWSGRLAQSTLKLSLMNAWTDTLRRAYGLTMMQGLARLSRTEWGALGEFDRAMMMRRGITEADWAVMRSAELTEFQGLEHLTPEAIRNTGHEDAPSVVAKMLGLIQDESEFAVMNPDLATKTMSSMGGTQAGTVKGELARSVMQFKSFPIAMISRHWRRMLDAPQVGDGSAPMLANRLVYSGALLASTTILGAIALQAKQIVTGKDPIDMRGEHAAKFWTKAVAQGGGLSIVGDMLLNDSGQSTADEWRGLAGTLLGPAAGTALQGLAIIKETAQRKAEGKQTHAAAETLNLARANAPYINLWYAKSALDHAGMHALQENLSPGYLGKMQQRAAKDFGQSFWYPPGTGLPSRAPDLGKAVGN